MVMLWFVLLALLFRGGSILSLPDLLGSQTTTRGKGGKNKPLYPQTPSLEPLFVTGFTDAEGCFEVVITQKNRSSTGTKYNYNLSYSIGLHKRDKVLLESLQAYFGGVGSLGVQNMDVVRYRVTSL